MYKEKRKFALRILWLTFLLFVALQIYYYPQLPERMAVHFGPSGKANSFMNKVNSFWLDIGILFFLSLLMWSLSVIIYKVKDIWLNLPNKDYWLAPQRRKDTLDYLSTSILNIGIATNIFIILLFYEVILANLSGSSRLNPAFWLVFLLYLLGIFWFTFSFVKKFSKREPLK